MPTRPALAPSGRLSPPGTAYGVPRRFFWHGLECWGMIARDDATGARWGVLTYADPTAASGRTDERIGLAGIDPDGFLAASVPDSYLRDAMIDALLLGILRPDPRDEGG